jgi:ribosomal protein S18 acetylase RimI-like enzyme
MELIMTNKISIRLADKRDITAIEAITAGTDLFPSDMVAEMIASFLSGEDTHIWFVACNPDDDVIGYGYCEAERMTDGTWNLLALAVSPKQQGTGCGKQLVSWIERHLTGNAARVLIIETAGVDEFAGVRAFYDGLGYTKEAVIREFYEPGVDKVVYWKGL